MLRRLHHVTPSDHFNESPGDRSAVPAAYKALDACIQKWQLRMTLLESFKNINIYCIIINVLGAKDSKLLRRIKTICTVGLLNPLATVGR